MSEGMLQLYERRIASGKSYLSSHGKGLLSQKMIASLTQVQVCRCAFVDFDEAAFDSHFMHAHHIIHMYSYARPSEIGHSWTPDAMFEYHNPCEYPADCCQNISIADMAKIRSRLGKALKWEEKRSDDIST